MSYAVITGIKNLKQKLQENAKVQSVYSNPSTKVTIGTNTEEGAVPMTPAEEKSCKACGGNLRPESPSPVSYTHLTLPTICSV